MQNSNTFLNVPKTRELLADWEKFKSLMYRSSGLDLNAYKFDQTYRRIWSMVERAGYKNFTAYYQYLQENPTRSQEFMDKLAINVSELFRNPEQFNLLKAKILPALLSKTAAVRVWSAGCSFGAEAYSIAVLLSDLSPSGLYKILGTDIDLAMLSRAKKGVFDDIEMKNVPDIYRRKYFQKVVTENKTMYEAVGTLRKNMEYRTHNLLESSYPDGFDLIACRNVVIYFSDEAKDKIFRNFYRSLKPGGFLFVGNTERIFNHKEIGFTNPEPFYYQKPEMLGGANQNA